MCLDPVTALAATSAAVSVTSSIQQGRYAAAQGAATQKLANEQARIQERAGEAEFKAALESEQRYRMAQNETLARQRSGFLAAGVDPGSGSALEVAMADARKVELDALTIRYGGEQARQAAFEQAGLTRQEGAIAASAGRAERRGHFLTAGAKALNAGSQLWDPFKKAVSKP